jgi:hypothetical protein
LFYRKMEVPMVLVPLPRRFCRRRQQAARRRVGVEEHHLVVVGLLEGLQQ